jgi:hypothetical protein
MIRVRGGCLAAAVFLFGATALASEKVSETEIARVTRAAQEGEIEREAQGLAISEKEFKVMRAEQRQARIDALKIELQRKRRKRFRQRIHQRSMYDDNYFREGRGGEQESIVFGLSGQTTLDLSGDRVLAVMNYTPSIEVPTRFEENQATQYEHRFSNLLAVPVGKRTFVRGSYSFFRGLNRPTSETANFSSRTEHDLSEEIEYFISRKTSAVFEHQFKERHFSETLRDSSQSLEHWFLPRFHYYFTPKTSVFLQAGGGETSGGNGQFDSSNGRVSMGVRGRLTQKSTVLINLGVLRKNLSENPPFVDDHTGPYLELVWFYRPTAKTKIDVIGGSSTEDSFFAGNSFLATRHLKVDLTQTLWRKLDLILGGAYRSSVFAAVGNARDNPDETGRRKDLQGTVSMGFLYHLRRARPEASISLLYTWDRKNSTIDTAEIRQQIWTISLDLEI